MLPSIHRLLDDGHELLAIFSFDCDNVFNYNLECQSTCTLLKIPFITDKVTPEHIQNFINMGAECFLSGGYPYKIPPVPESIYAMNIHPTYLPEGRGIMPIPKIIKENIKSAAGFTVHKMTEKFDAGDIIAQTKVALSENDTVESYSAKISVHAPSVLSKIFGDFKRFWNNARPQQHNKSTYYSPPTDDDRVLHWEMDVNSIMATARAFGRFGSIAIINGDVLIVYECAGWQEKHSLEPSKLVNAASNELIIAAKNGYILLKRFEEIQS